MPHIVESVLLEKGSEVIAVRSDTTVRQAADKMIDANVGCLIVEDEENVVGIFTERDVLRRVIGGDKDPYSTIVSEVMTSENLVTAAVGTSLKDAEIILQKHKIERRFCYNDTFTGFDKCSVVSVFVIVLFCSIS